MSQRRAQANPAKRGRLLAEPEPPQNTSMNTPWQIRQLTTGEWVVDQVWSGRKRRFGTYATEAEAKEILAVLRRGK